MSQAKISLEQIQIPQPCPVSWESMSGDDQVRFCGQCKQSVYNLSGMTRDDAEQLIAERGGQLCGQIYVRPDGTVVTADCKKIRFAIVRKAVYKVAAGIALLFAIGFSGVLWGATYKSVIRAIMRVCACINGSVGISAGSGCNASR